MSSKRQVDQWFTRTVEDWDRCYVADKPASLSAQNLVSRKRFTLEMLAARIPQGSTILDVGCGTGHLTSELLKRGYDAWGVDFSTAMVEYAREHYDPDRFRAGDIEQIPFPDNAFDAMICLGVMEYLERDDLALREIWRVLKPGGLAVITTPSITCPFFHLDTLFEKMRILARPLFHLLRYRLRGRPIPNRDRAPAVIHRRYYRSRWINLMRSHGLQLADWACHSWGCYSLEAFLGQGAFCRVSDRFARNSAINWLASNQVACVRAIK